MSELREKIAELKIDAAAVGREAAIAARESAIRQRLLKGLGVAEGSGPVAVKRFMDIFRRGKKP